MVNNVLLQHFGHCCQELQLQIQKIEVLAYLLRIVTLLRAAEFPKRDRGDASTTERQWYALYHTYLLAEWRSCYLTHRFEGSLKQLIRRVCRRIFRRKTEVSFHVKAHSLDADPEDNSSTLKFKYLHETHFAVRMKHIKWRATANSRMPTWPSSQDGLRKTHHYQQEATNLFMTIPLWSAAVAHMSQVTQTVWLPPVLSLVINTSHWSFTSMEPLLLGIFFT